MRSARVPDPRGRGSFFVKPSNRQPVNPSPSTVKPSNRQRSNTHGSLPHPKHPGPLVVLPVLPAEDPGDQGFESVPKGSERIAAPAHDGLRLATQPTLQRIEIAHAQRLNLERDVVVIAPRT